jgi:hypothetical protein
MCVAFFLGNYEWCFSYRIYLLNQFGDRRLTVKRLVLTLSLLMSYIYGAPCKAKNLNIVYIYIYMDLRLAMLKAVSISRTMFQH